MSNERRVLVHPDKAALAGSVAARFITKVIDLLDLQDDVYVCLTGGTMGSAVLAAINGSSARDSVDWSRIRLVSTDAVLGEAEAAMAAILETYRAPNLPIEKLDRIAIKREADRIGKTRSCEEII